LRVTSLGGRQQAQVRDLRYVVVSANSQSLLSARWLRWKKQKSTSLRAFDTGSTKRDGVETQNAPRTIFSLGWECVARAALHRRRLPTELACWQADDRPALARYSHSFRAKMARAHCLRHQRSNAACGYRRKLRARQPGATDDRRHSGSRARSAGSVADIRRRPDNGREPEEAGSEGAASTKNHQTTGCAARAPGRAAAAICLVWRPHVVVSTPKRINRKLRQAVPTDEAPTWYLREREKLRRDACGGLQMMRYSFQCE